MLSLLWPTNIKPEPTLLGRLGRVLHWLLTLYAVLLLIVGLFNLNTASQLEVSTGLFSADGSPSPETPQEAAQWHREQGTQWLFQALVAFFAGRICRYVLSGE